MIRLRITPFIQPQLCAPVLCLVSMLFVSFSQATIAAAATSSTQFAVRCESLHDPLPGVIANWFRSHDLHEAPLSDESVAAQNAQNDIISTLPPSHPLVQMIHTFRMMTEAQQKNVEKSLAEIREIETSSRRLWKKMAAIRKILFMSRIRGESGKQILANDRAVEELNSQIAQIREKMKSDKAAVDRAITDYLRETDRIFQTLFEQTEEMGRTVCSGARCLEFLEAANSYVSSLTSGAQSRSGLTKFNPILKLVSGIRAWFAARSLESARTEIENYMNQLERSLPDLPESALVNPNQIPTFVQPGNPMGRPIVLYPIRTVIQDLSRPGVSVSLTSIHRRIKEIHEQFSAVLASLNNRLETQICRTMAECPILSDDDANVPEALREP